MKMYPLQSVGAHSGAYILGCDISVTVYAAVPEKKKTTPFIYASKTGREERGDSLLN